MAHACEFRRLDGSVAYGRRGRGPQRPALGDRSRLSEPKPLRLGVAGVGPIGGSIALRASSCGMHVTGFDRDPEAIAVARERGMLDAHAETFAALVEHSDVLALAGPLEATLAQLEALNATPPRAHLIFDVASVKSPVAAAGRMLATFVASHPIAGSERSGPGAARADLFQGRTWTIDAHANAAPQARARTLFESFGATVLEIDSARHDRTIALTSHLPQLVSVALGARLGTRLDDGVTRELCGTGMRSMLRLGASSWPMWRAVLAANSVSIAQEVRGLAAILSDAADMLETERVDEIAAEFAAAGATVAILGDAATDRKGKT